MERRLVDIPLGTLGIARFCGETLRVRLVSTRVGFPLACAALPFESGSASAAPFGVAGGLAPLHPVTL
jgi:hypothetical protein